MDAAIAKTTNDELKKLQLKLEILEEQLREAQTRADVAEEQLALYQQAEQQQTRENALQATAPPPPPPPPPPPAPPMPAKLLFAVGAAGEDGGGSFSQHIAAHNLHKGASDKIIDNVKQQVQAQAATGMSSAPAPFLPLPFSLYLSLSRCVCVSQIPLNVKACTMDMKLDGSVCATFTSPTKFRVARPSLFFVYCFALFFLHSFPRTLKAAPSVGVWGRYK